MTMTPGHGPGPDGTARYPPAVPPGTVNLISGMRQSLSYRVSPGNPAAQPAPANGQLVCPAALFSAILLRISALSVLRQLLAVASARKPRSQPYALRATRRFGDLRLGGGWNTTDQPSTMGDKWL